MTTTYSQTSTEISVDTTFTQSTLPSFLFCNATGPITVTIPDPVVDSVVGAWLFITNKGTDLVTVAGSSGSYVLQLNVTALFYASDTDWTYSVVSTVGGQLSTQYVDSVTTNGSAVVNTNTSGMLLNTASSSIGGTGFFYNAASGINVTLDPVFSTSYNPIGYTNFVPQPLVFTNGGVTSVYNGGSIDPFPSTTFPAIVKEGYSVGSTDEVSDEMIIINPSDGSIRGLYQTVSNNETQRIFANSTNTTAMSFANYNGTLDIESYGSGAQVTLGANANQNIKFDGINVSLLSPIYTSGGTGSAGQLLASQGSGSAPQWISATGVGSSVPTASTVAEWDPNVNMGANSFIPSLLVTDTSTSYLGLTVTSPQEQVLTGTTSGMTLALPITTTLANAQYYVLANISTQIITVTTGSLTTLFSLYPGTTAQVICVNNTSDVPASWIVR